LHELQNTRLDTNFTIAVTKDDQCGVFVHNTSYSSKSTFPPCRGRKIGQRECGTEGMWVPEEYQKLLLKLFEKSSTRRIKSFFSWGK